MNGKVCGKKVWHNLRHKLDFFEGLRKLTANVSQNSWYVGQVLNLGSAEHEAGMLST
jgi:hypothetical protein